MGLWWWMFQSGRVDDADICGMQGVNEICA